MTANEIGNLMSTLSEIERLTNEEWMNSLDNRKKDELAFHDKHRDASLTDNLDKDTYEKFYGNKKYYNAAQPSMEYVYQWLVREVRNLVFLDYCCGNGSNAIRAAKAGAKMAIGIDLSSVSIANARRFAEEAGVSENTRFVQADAENTKLPDNSIDRAICSGCLHHLDLTKAFPELHRILAPGGKLIALESLDYNPVIKLYRYLTPEMRTDWEKAHILSMKDIEYAKKLFAVGEIHFWHILAILHPHLPSLGSVFQGVDNILTKIPLIRLMAWMFTFELVKPKG